MAFDMGFPTVNTNSVCSIRQQKILCVYLIKKQKKSPASLRGSNESSPQKWRCWFTGTPWRLGKLSHTSGGKNSGSAAFKGLFDVRGWQRTISHTWIDETTYRTHLGRHCLVNVKACIPTICDLRLQGPDVSRVHVIGATSNTSGCIERLILPVIRIPV